MKWQKLHNAYKKWAYTAGKPVKTKGSLGSGSSLLSSQKTRSVNDLNDQEFRKEFRIIRENFQSLCEGVYKYTANAITKSANIMD